MADPDYTDSIMLFGDSLTQAFTNGSYSQLMAQTYIRKMDILNRGFSGYTTEGGLAVFEKIFATKERRDKGIVVPVKLVTIWFGANDASLPGNTQHIPLELFKANLSQMVTSLQSPTSDYYAPDTKIVLITPPPIMEAARLRGMNIRWKEFGSEGEPPTVCDRNKGVTRQYAQAVVEVAKKENVPFVDLWTAIVDAAGGEGEDELAPYFYDGLHLTPEGYDVLYKELMKLILSRWPEFDPEEIIPRMPFWKELQPDPRAEIEKSNRLRAAGKM
ncbi:hypothetical protein P7C73_g6262, partial [Tremellales sp. Uapishka_1]